MPPFDWEEEYGWEDDELPTSVEQARTDALFWDIVDFSYQDSREFMALIARCKRLAAMYPLALTGPTPLS